MNINKTLLTHVVLAQYSAAFETNHKTNVIQPQWNYFELMKKLVRLYNTLILVFIWTAIATWDANWSFGVHKKISGGIVIGECLLENLQYMSIHI